MDVLAALERVDQDVKKCRAHKKFVLKASAKVKRYNDNHATRRKGLIVLDDPGLDSVQTRKLALRKARSKTGILAKGAYKRWTAAAMLRVS